MRYYMDFNNKGSIDWDIIEKSFSGELSKAEEQILMNWLSESKSHRDYYNSAMQGGVSDPVAGLDPKINQRKREEFISKIKSSKKKRYSFKKRLLYYVAASLIPITLVLSALFYQSIVNYLKSENNSSNQYALNSGKDIMPGSSKAILVLDDGREINLDSTGKTIDMGYSKIVTVGKQLTYQKTTLNTMVPIYNKLLIPRGGEYQLVLSDGTKIWLNSETLIVYPIEFSGATREVSLKGEAYFEVAKNEKMPFIIKTDDFMVRVTGTSFNVNSYEDMSKSDITVETGTVELTNSSGIINKITAQQQYIFDRITGEVLVQKADVGAATSWKDGYFLFDKEPLEIVVKKISRWYDVDAIIQTERLAKTRFAGKIKKYETMSKVMDMLELTNEISYSIDKNVIVISSK